MTRILVTGGNGALGREVVKQLVERGYTARIMSRRPRPSVLRAGTEWAQADLETGQGVAKSLGDSEGLMTALGACGSLALYILKIDT